MRKRRAVLTPVLIGLKLTCRLQVACGLSGMPVQFSSSRWKLPTAPPEMIAMKAPPDMLPWLVTSIALVTPSEPTGTEPKLVGLLSAVSSGRPPSPLSSAVELVPASDWARSWAENGPTSEGLQLTWTAQV